MSNISNIFKAYDIRGKVNSELTPDVSLLIGRSFGDWLNNDAPVVVGYDMRPDSRNLALAIIKGLNMQGKDVWDIGEVTSDMVYFTTGFFKLGGGVMITASHNPGEYNGIKLCKEQVMPVGEESGLLDIKNLAISKSFKKSKKTGMVIKKDITEDWISHVFSFIDIAELNELKIVVDAGNGMAGKIFPEVEPYLPFDVRELFFDLDGTFPNHIANPLDPKNLIDIQALIKKYKADLGIAFDGDGDRAVLIDEKGEPLSGTTMTALLAEYFLNKYPGSNILCNAICGQAAFDAIESHGGKAIRTKVGHSFIKSDMRKYKAIFAGEHSGHYYFKDNYMADSGLIAAIVAISILCKSNKSLSELVKPYRKAYIQIPETNFEVVNKQEVIEKIATEFRQDKQDRLDGLTVYFKDGWFNVRPSNTEPLMRLNAEAKSKDKLMSIVNKVSGIINS